MGEARMSVVLERGRMTTPETLDGDQEELKPLKSVFTLKPCMCGATIGYLTIGHVPIAFEEDDPDIAPGGIFASMGEVVDAPGNAVLWKYLRGTPKCWNKYRA